MKVKRPRRFGKFVSKAQTGAEANVGETVKNNPNPKNQFNAGTVLSGLTPLAGQFVNAQAQKQLQKNTYRSDDPFYNQVYGSAYAQNVSYNQQQQQGQNQLTGNVLSSGLNMAMPGLGLVVPATDFLGNTLSNPQQKYGISYYKNDRNAVLSDLSLSKRFGDMVRKDEDEKWGEYALNWATGGGYNMLSKTTQRNQENLNKIKQLENAESALRQLNEYKTQGIYAKKGVKFGNYTLHQVQGMPKHKDNIVYDSVENKIYPAMQKGAGGVVINFAGNEKVLIENGEYVVKDADGNSVAVLPEKIGKDVISGKITVEQAFKKIPNIKDAETAKVAQDGAINEAQVQEENIQTQMSSPQMLFPQQQNPLSVRGLIHENNPVLFAIISQTPKNKAVAKKGIVNDDGYLYNSKNKNNPVNIIKSNVITTEGMAFPIYANGQLLMPNTGIYKFKQQYVVETPATEAEKAKCGIKHYGKYATKAQSGLYNPFINSVLMQNQMYPYTSLSDYPSYQDYINKNRNKLITTPSFEGSSKRITDKTPNDLGSLDIKNTPLTKEDFDKLSKDTAYQYPKSFWYDPDIEKSNEYKTPDIDWTDPDINKTPNDNYDNFVNEGSRFKTKIIPNITNPLRSVMNSNNEFRPVDINSPAQYAFGLLNLYKAYTAKPSERGRYHYDPEVARLLAQSKYYEQRGDQQGYKNALKKIEAERMRAMQQATQTNTSAGSYMNTLASLAGNLSQAQQSAYSDFITKKQQEGRLNTQNLVSTVHASEREKVFKDMLADYKEKQDFANAREQKITASLDYLTDALQKRRESGLQQYNSYLNYIGKANENLIEYYLMYGTPEEKAYAKKLLENPTNMYPRIQNKWGAMNYGTYTPRYVKNTEIEK